MKLVYGVGRVKVLSNREVSSVRGSIVHFVGGSFCDIQTGDFFIKPGDRIAVGYVELSELTRRDPISFTHITDVILDTPQIKVVFTNHDGPDVIMSATGTEEDLESIQFAATSGVLAVGFRKPESKKLFKISLEQIKDLTDLEDHRQWHENELVAFSTVPPIQSTLTISLPRTRSVDISIVKPKAALSFGEILGNLSLITTGGIMNLGEINNLTHVVKGTAATTIELIRGVGTIELAGSGLIEIKKVDCSELKITSAGSGKIQVNSGKCDKLTVKSTSGKTALNLTATNANFDTPGGHVTVSQVTNTPMFLRGVANVAILDMNPGN